MTMEFVRTGKAPSSPYYSQAVKAAGLVFVSGQGPFHPQTGEVIGETIQEQVRQCLRNVSEILSAGGSSLEKVVSATCIFAQEADFPGLNEEWIKWFENNTQDRQVAY